MSDCKIRPSVLSSAIRASSHIYPRVGLKWPFMRFRFFCRAIAHHRLLQTELSRATPYLFETFDARPEAIGLIEWPYIHSDWDVKEKVASLVNHHALVEKIELLRVPVGMRRDLCDLSSIEPGLFLVLDRPRWFLREGEISLNLFLHETRLYTVAFSMEENESGQLGVVVGGIQGRSIVGAKDVYSHLTKVLHGARPRDFLLSVLMILCQSLNVSTLRGVSEESRHHRNVYFGRNATKTESADYDDIWLDRGGALGPDGFFYLEPKLQARSLDEIPSKKRAMYRRRLEMYSMIESNIKVQIERPSVFSDQLPG